MPRWTRGRSATVGRSALAGSLKAELPMLPNARNTQTPLRNTQTTFRSTQRGFLVALNLPPGISCCVLRPQRPALRSTNNRPTNAGDSP